MVSGLGRVILAAGMAAAMATAGGCIIVVDGTHGSSGYHASDWAKAKRTWSADIDQALLDATTSLAVSSRSGDVSIELVDGPGRVEAMARGPDADRVKMVRLSIEAHGDELRITPRWPRGSWRDNESVDLQISIPRREGVEVKTSAGDVEVNRMAGRLRIETSAGDIDVSHHKGPARLHSSAGDIFMEHVAGDIGAETSAGDIDLHDVGWPIEAITSAGDVTVFMRPGFSGQMHAITSAGEVRLPEGDTETRRNGPFESATLTLGEGKDECVFKTSAGDVTVSVQGG